MMSSLVWKVVLCGNALVAMIIAAGCGASATSDEGSAARNAPAATENSTSAGKFPYYHDFGVIWPGSTLAHSFVVRNDTQQSWTVRSVERTCNCTATTLSSATIRPGNAATVVVRYDAPGSNTDDQKSVTLHFEEPGVSAIVLTVAAHVRRPLTLQPEELSIVRVAAGSTVERVVEAWNFSDADWQGVEVRQPVDSAWLAAEVVAAPISRDGAALAPRQMWRISLRAEAQHESFGNRQCVLQIVPIGGDPSFTVNLPLTVAVEPPIVCVPEQLFFGSIAGGESTSRIVTVHFAENIAPAGIQGVFLSHDVSEPLQLEWVKSTGRYWHLRATITPAAGASRLATGTIVMEVKSANVPPVRLAVSALVK